MAVLYLGWVNSNTALCRGERLLMSFLPSKALHSNIRETNQNKKTILENSIVFNNAVLEPTNTSIGGIDAFILSLKSRMI